MLVCMQSSDLRHGYYSVDSLVSPGVRKMADNIVHAATTDEDQGI